MCSCYLCVSALKLRSLRINERERERARALNLNITRNPETILCAFTETFHALTSATPSRKGSSGLSATSCASPVIMLLCSATMCTRVSCHKARRRHDARSPATMSCLLSPSTMRSRSTMPCLLSPLTWASAPGSERSQPPGPRDLPEIMPGVSTCARRQAVRA